MSGRAILHVDMDAFFASVEQRENPAWRGLPVIVGADPDGGRGRGVVAACSYEARRFGVHSALPISQAWRLCPKAVYVRPNGALYSAVSRAVMEILGRFTDLVEPISIDEAFLDVTGSRKLFGDAPTIARAIKAAIREEQRITCSVGIASNKFLAKIASDLDKPDGLTVVEAGSEREFLRELPVRSMWGVGPKLERRLLEMGVRTIGDIAARPQAEWLRALGAHGDHLWRLSQGLDERPVLPHSGFKSLSHEHTYSTDTADLGRIRQTLLALSESVARRARKNRVVGGVVTLKWRWADFTTLTRQSKLAKPTDDARQIYGKACELAERLQPMRQKVRLVGVGLSHFEDARRQAGLFDGKLSEGKNLGASLDRIAEKFGSAAVRKASLLDRPDDEDGRFSSFLKR